MVISQFVRIWVNNLAFWVIIKHIVAIFEVLGVSIVFWVYPLFSWNRRIQDLCWDLDEHTINDFKPGKECMRCVYMLKSKQWCSIVGFSFIYMVVLLCLSAIPWTLVLWHFLFKFILISILDGSCLLWIVIPLML